MTSSYDLEIGVIRKALKSLAPTLSVRKGRGTAYSWIEIRGSGRYGEFTPEERRALEAFGLGYGANAANIAPEDRRNYVEKAAQMLGIPLPGELAREYARRDAYRQELEKQAEERRRLRETCPHDWKPMPYLVFPSGRLYKCTRCGLEEIRDIKRPRWW